MTDTDLRAALTGMTIRVQVPNVGTMTGFLRAESADEIARIAAHPAPDEASEGPDGEGWVPFGTHAYCGVVMEFSEDDADGLPRWERVCVPSAEVMYDELRLAQPDAPAPSPSDRALTEDERLARVIRDVAEAEGDGFTTEVYGVKVAKCDTYGQTESERILAARLAAVEAERDRLETVIADQNAEIDAYKHDSKRAARRIGELENELGESREAEGDDVALAAEVASLRSQVAAASGKSPNPYAQQEGDR